MVHVCTIFMSSHCSSLIIRQVLVQAYLYQNLDLAGALAWIRTGIGRTSVSPRNRIVIAPDSLYLTIILSLCSDPNDLAPALVFVLARHGTSHSTAKRVTLTHGQGSRIISSKVYQSAKNPS